MVTIGDLTMIQMARAAGDQESEVRVQGTAFTQRACEMRLAPFLPQASAVQDSRLGPNAEVPNGALLISNPWSATS